MKYGAFASTWYVESNDAPGASHGASLISPSVTNVRFSALCNFVLVYLSLYA